LVCFSFVLSGSCLMFSCGIACFLATQFCTQPMGITFIILGIIIACIIIICFPFSTLVWAAEGIMVKKRTKYRQSCCPSSYSGFCCKNCFFFFFFI
jgi:hypothetical protein